VRSPTTLAAATAVFAFAVSGCGGEKSDSEQVRDVVLAFGEATAKHDYQRICDDLLAPSLVDNLEQVGLPCEVAWRRGLGAVKAPTLKIKTVAVNGGKALVAVRSAAKGQKASEDVIELQLTGGAWRIASLARPQPQPPASTGP
jgi:hypothetical protein